MADGGGMHPRKLLPLGAVVLVIIAALLTWRTTTPSVPGEEAPPVPATLAGEPAAPVPAPARQRPAPTAEPAQPLPDASAPDTASRGTSTPAPWLGADPSTPPGASTPAATPAPASGEATVSKDDIRAAVREVLPGLRRCYAPVAERDRATHKVVVRFTLVGQGSSGFFKDADILEDTTLDDPVFLSCLLQELSQARFRAPWGTGEVTITYPFTLAPSPRDGG
jgi:hypothetical protein